MKKFLFVTCLTPQSLLTDLRKDLHKEYLKALSAQTNTNWVVYLLGEKEECIDSFNYIKCIGKTKEDKLIEAFHLIKQLEQKPEFIIRLDDDDLISEDALSKVEALQNKYDVFTDEYQAMFDTYYGKSLEKKFPWWPSTLIMKYNDAMSIQPEFSNKPLFACSHDLAFHKYFKKHKVFYSEKQYPFYRRIFSPTSLSFKTFDGKTDIVKYNQYLKTYGFWKFYSDATSKKLRNIYLPIALKYYNKKYNTNLYILYNTIASIDFKVNITLKKIINKIYRNK